MENFPKITVVTPVFNGEKYIEKTIKSVLDQNYPNLEYMIFDGGSTDKTVSIIKKYADRISYWTSEKDDGLYSAIQKGFDRSTGEIMAWINSDDYYSEHCFEIVAEIFTKFPEVEWLTGLNTHYCEKGYMIDAWHPRRFTRLDFLNGDYKFVQQESTFWKRSLWEKAGATLGKYRLADDFELWLRFSRYALLYTVNAYLAGFRCRSENQISLNHFSEYLAECDDAIKNEEKSDTEKKCLKKIRFWKRLEKILSKTKVLNRNFPNRFINRIYKKLYKDTEISFNRETQEFILR